MVRGMTRSNRRGDSRTARHPHTPTFESLEGRTVLSASLANSPLVHALSTGVHTSQQQAILGTIQGRVTNAATGRSLDNVKVELIGANGTVVQSTISHAGGQYKFKIQQIGPYVVHVVSPRRFVQTTPTFATTAPTGAMAINPATGNPFNGSSWNYHTGNSNPDNGPVGPPFWSTVAPAGNLPFESPINITGAPVDLGQVLSVHYNNAVPKQIINNGAQIQVQFPANGADTITLGGQAYNLSQFHYHDPSENTVNGQSYSMEEHFVNVSASGAETVLAVFLQLGAHNSALDPILNAAMTSLTSPNTSTTIPTAINFAGLLPSSMMGWFYQGSLTTPPLSQVVNWLVFSTPITLDFQQLQEYEHVAAGSGFLPNNRPIQPTDGRTVNQIDFDVNFQGQGLVGLNFGLTPTSSSSAASVKARAATTTVAQLSASSTTVQAQSQALHVLQSNPTLASAAAAQNYTPVAGCNCPLCQMLRNAVWHHVNLAAIETVPPAKAPAAGTSSHS
jgi:carbonic anhydrase